MRYRHRGLWRDVSATNKVKEIAMTAAETADRAQLHQDPDERHDRLINLQDQHHQVQREVTERGEREALAAAQRQPIDHQHPQRVEAYDLIDQAHDGLRQAEQGIRHIGLGTALSVSALAAPPRLRPTLFIDLLVSSAIATLSVHREFLNVLLTTASPSHAR